MTHRGHPKASQLHKGAPCSVMHCCRPEPRPQGEEAVFLGWGSLWSPSILACGFPRTPQHHKTKNLTQDSISQANSSEMGIKFTPIFPSGLLPPALDTTGEQLKIQKGPFQFPMNSLGFPVDHTWICTTERLPCYLQPFLFLFLCLLDPLFFGSSPVPVPD